MQTTFALVAALASVAYTAPQGITAPISPPGSAPAGAQTSYNGKFEITAYNTTAKRDLEKRVCDAEGSLTLTLVDGILKDAQGRIGYVAANQQFQFDGPPQAGAIYTAGWSVLTNGSLALGPSSVFWQCKSGNPNGGDAGAFYNLYFDKAFDICTPAAINILPCGGSSGGSTGGSVGEQGDGQPTGPGAVAPPVTQIGDGQVQMPTGVAVSQIPDGQVQAPTGAPVSQIPDGQIQAPTGAPVSQIPDGQVQAPTGVPVSQIPDGQVQAPTGAPISQIPDGQVQAPTGAPITQISDGQIQAPTATGAPITQISDGQIQAPTETGAPITQIPDGQVQAPTGTGNSSSPIPFTGAGNTLKASVISIIGAVVAVAFL